MKKVFFLLVCLMLSASMTVSARSVLTATCYENDFAYCDDVIQNPELGNLSEFINGLDQPPTWGENGLVMISSTQYSEGRIYRARFDTYAGPKGLDISIPACKKVELKFKIQGFIGFSDNPFTKYDNFLRFFAKASDRSSNDDGIEHVQKPYLGDRPKEYHLTFDLSKDWHTKGDNNGHDSNVPADFLPTDYIKNWSIRPNNPEGGTWDMWGSGIITLIYIKVGDYVIRKTTVPLTAGTAVNVDLKANLQEGVTFSAVTAAVSQLPAGITVSSDGIVSGTPAEAITKSVNMQVKYRLAGDTEDRITVEKLYFAPGTNSAINTATVSNPVVSETYYTLQGQETAQPGKGVYIVKQTLQSGAVKTIKQLK